MLLDQLKSQTRQQHEHLEQLNGLPGSREDYVALLEKFHGYVAPWEQHLASRVAATDPLRAGREKTGWLAADLADFGVDAAGLRALPRCANLPAGESRAALLGACYVLEGATLGGQFIARHVATVLSLPSGHGDRYFRGYGAETGAKWQAFRQELLRHSSPEADPVIVRAAQETFAKIGCWFEARRAVTA